MTNESIGLATTLAMAATLAGGWLCHRLWVKRGEVIDAESDLMGGVVIGLFCGAAWTSLLLVLADAVAA